MLKAPLPERKTPAHMPIAEGGKRPTIVFVTVCSEKRKPILAHPDVHELLQYSWNQADAWLVGRYVIMPDHIHLFCAPGSLKVPELTRWVQYWKTTASKVWPRPDDHPIWQKSFWDTQLRHVESYSSKWDYVRMNPVRAGLCPAPDEWTFQGEMQVLPWND
jgi:putative transposase